MNTLDELERLLKAGTPGPWKIERGKRCIQGPDTGEGDALVITSMMGGSKQWSASPYSQYCVPGMKDGDANAALIVAAINALPALLESARRVEEMRAALQDAHTWHESADKAISKQPNANQGTNGWNRLQHQEQMELISNVLKGA